MKYRPLGRTGWNVSDISFGAWAIGGAWGPVSDEESMKALHAAIDEGVNLIDTADVYGNGRSERLVSQNAADHRISFGCVVVPVDFYERVVAATLGKRRGVVYVLPETRPVQEMFGALELSAAAP